MKELDQPETQKARGIAWLSKKLATGFTNKWKPTSNPHFFYKADFTHKEGTWNFPVFARPCPITPRHGFVDSRICNSLEELNKVHQETLVADPQGEVAITEPIRASHSAILAGNMLVIGRGNDSATAGRKTHTLRLVDPPLHNLIDNKAPINIKDEIPFFEFVYKTKNIKALLTQESECVCVQMRSVPKTADIPSVDYIPEDTTITNIIPAKGDLLEWEKLMTTVPKGTVIDAFGSSLASHYAIHGILNKVPVLTSLKPTIGMQLKQTMGLSNNEDKSNDLYNGFKSAIHINPFNNLVEDEIGLQLAKLGRISIALLHNAATLLNSGYIYELGLACGTFVKVITILCYGEARHYSKAGMTREIAYITGTTLDSIAFSKAMSDTYLLFCTQGWSSGFGGKAWANIILGAIHIWNACIDKDIQKAISELNKAINLEHNGGWCMNKVLTQEDFNFAASQPGVYALRYAPVLYELIDIFKSDTISYPQLEKIVVDENLVKGSYIGKHDPILQSITLDPIKVKIPSISKVKQDKTVNMLLGSWPDITYMQARLLSNNNIKVQYKMDDTEEEQFSELDIPKAFFTKQAIYVFKTLGKGSLFSLAKTEQKYHEMKQIGKKKENVWFCINKKRILSLKNFCKYIGWQIPEIKKDKEPKSSSNKIQTLSSQYINIDKFTVKPFLFQDPFKFTTKINLSISEEIKESNNQELKN